MANLTGSGNKHPWFIGQSLIEPDVGLSKSLYGIDFRDPLPQELSNFTDLCGTLAQERDRLLINDPLPLSSLKPALLYMPTKFLAAPLSNDQVSAINERETPPIAEYCVDVQKKIGQVLIRESLEPMQHLPKLFDEHSVDVSFSEVPFPDVAGEWAGRPQEFWVRKSFARRLVIMGKILNKVGIRPHFIEAFRPVGVQESMFKRRVQTTRDAHPSWSEEQTIAESQSKTASTPRLASHKGGAAVDLLLQDMRNGELLDFGHGYPDGGVLVFPRIPYVTADQWKNRQTLQAASGLLGLKLYVGEDWHISFGDNLASLDENNDVTPGYIAQFGPVKEFDRTNGAITEIYEPAELDEMFGT